MTPLIHLLLSVLAGVLPPVLALLALRLHRCRCCRCLGHDWGRYQIDAAHYRDPAALPFHKCTRCKHVELIEPDVPEPFFDNMELIAFSYRDLVAMATSLEPKKPPPAEPLPRPGSGRSYDA